MPADGSIDGGARLAEIRAGGKPAIAHALSALERKSPTTGAMTPETIALLDAAFATPKGEVIGLTGPPGVGKSTLVQAMIVALREADRSVAVLAIDPSSRRTGGALLGDRTRLKTDPLDSGVFVRSLAARDRLGGLSAEAVAITVLLRAVYDVVIVESVGVGQSEQDIALVADKTVLCIQPGSGDSLQFMKAGIMEIPDMILVTKADTGRQAARAVADVEGALSLSSSAVPVCAVSAVTGEGVAAFIEGLAALPDMSVSRRAAQAAHWLDDAIQDRFGRDGLRRLGALRPMLDLARPFAAIAKAETALNIY